MLELYWQNLFSGCCLTHACLVKVVLSKVSRNWLRHSPQMKAHVPLVFRNNYFVRGWIVLIASSRISKKYSPKPSKLDSGSSSLRPKCLKPLNVKPLNLKP